MTDIRDPKLYETWSSEDLEAHIKMLREMQRKKEGARPLPSKELLKSLIGPNSTDFLGTGLSLQDFLLTYRIQEFQESFAAQSGPEKRRRLRFIISMATELAKIRAVSVYATNHGEAAIEALILGDWKMLSEWMGYCTFDDEDASTRDRYKPLWANFVTLCREAFQTRPQAAPPVTETRH